MTKDFRVQVLVCEIRVEATGQPTSSCTRHKAVKDPSQYARKINMPKNIVGILQ